VRANGLYVLHSAGSVENHKECEMQPLDTCLAEIQRVRNDDTNGGLNASPVDHNKKPS
jgi:hypothetical protein